MGFITFPRDYSIFSDYKRLRQAVPNLTSAIMKCLSRPAIMDCAKRLGLRKGKGLIFGNMQEMDVFMDYCIYSYRKRGKNAIQRYAEDFAPPEASDDVILLQAMLHSHYSIFQVRDLERGRGVTLFDLLRSENLLLLDVGLSSSAIRGMMFAGRVLPLNDYYMTSGAFIPLDREFVEKTVIPTVERFLSKIHREAESVLSPADESQFSAEIIRPALRAGMLERMAYSRIENK
jgi:hypothetical protein